jgi:hypothetical protein
MKKCKSLAEAESFFEQTEGDKVMLLNRKLFKSSIDFEQVQDNAEELTYYRLIGEAYNSHKLDRATVKDELPGTEHFTYIVDG